MQQIVDDFARYADIVFTEFGARIKHWSTFNEPRTFCTLGYGMGVHAPGIKSVESAWQCVQHVLEAHAAAFKKFKAKVPGGELCMNLDGEWGEPASDSAADREAAQTHRDYHYGLFADPIYLGRYPQSIIDHAPAGLGKISPQLAADLKGSQTLYCFNGYTTRWVKARKGALQGDGLGVADYDGLTELNGKTIGPRGEPEWLYSVPWGFKAALVYLNKRYNPGNMAVTEFGIACPGEDALPLKAALNDTCRVDYYRDYIKAAADAKAEGAPISIVFPWSFSDNLEWAEGGGGGEGGGEGTREKGEAQPSKKLESIPTHPPLSLRLQTALRPDLRRLQDADALPQGLVRLREPAVGQPAVGVAAEGGGHGGDGDGGVGVR